jgi:hypothetical protein
MKKHLFLMMIAVAITVSGYAQTTPQYAASTKTWTFGEQTWSDAIHIPACNKESFTDDDNYPQCRSYTKSGSTWYYYNWAYVDQNAAALCPSPWRVFTQSDFETLVNSTDDSTLINAWGYGGYAYGSSMYNVGTYGYYWSSTEDGSSNAYYLNFGTDGYVLPQYYYNAKYYGFQVRCVR